mgnify:CR=1 FL=1|jgi:hypothetical protein
MKLLTAKIKAALPPLYSTEDTPCEDKQVVVKFFNPMGAGTWYIVEGSQQDGGDWLLFGYCDLGLGTPEWGYVSLRELQSVKLPFGMGIERDIYFSPQTISL